MTTKTRIYRKMIVAFNGQKRYEYRFNNKQEFIDFKDKVKKYPHVKVYEVNIRKATPKPDDLELKSGHLYCSYCIGSRKFIYNSYTGYSRCEVCNISTQEFWIKTHNGIWNVMESKRAPLNPRPNLKEADNRRPKRPRKRRKK